MFGFFGGVFGFVMFWQSGNPVGVLEQQLCEQPP